MDHEFLTRRASLLRIAAASMGVALTGHLDDVLTQAQARGSSRATACAPGCRLA